MLPVISNIILALHFKFLCISVRLLAEGPVDHLKHQPREPHTNGDSRYEAHPICWLFNSFTETSFCNQ